MAKSKKPGAKKPTGKKKAEDETIDLEETLTHVTDVVRQGFAKHRVTVIALLVVVVGGFGIYKLLDARSISALEEVNHAVFEAKRDPVTAEVNLRKLAKEHPDRAFIQVELATWLQQNGQWAEAAEIWKQVCDKYPDTALVKAFADQPARLESADRFEIPAPLEGPDPIPELPVTGDPATAPSETPTSPELPTTQPAPTPTVEGETLPPPPVPTTEEAPTSRPGDGR